MKNPNEKKQDLLLDALSCIDDDILEKGLALRAQSASPRRDTPAETEAFPPPPTFVLSELDKKPKTKLWRILPIAAAACFLAVIIPAALLVAALLVGNGANAPLPEHSQTGDMGGLLPPMDAENGEEADGTNAMAPEEAPATDAGRDDSTELLPESPDESATEIETSDHHDSAEGGFSSDVVWTTVDHTNQFFGYTGISPSGKTVTLLGTVELEGQLPDQTVSPKDELVLKLAGQWFLSVYCLDYGIHFPLFPDEVIDERIMYEIRKEGLTYEQALEKINRTANDTAGFEHLNLSLHLVSNVLLTGSNLEEYRRQFAEYHPDSMDANEITAVRKFQFSEENQVIVDGRFFMDPLDVPTGFYAYEYNGQWYLDTQSSLEDDLCIDLLQSDPGSSAYDKTQTQTGVITALDEDYLYMNGLAFQIRDVTPPDGIQVGDTVTVTYHGLGASFLAEESDGLVQTTEPKVRVYKCDRIRLADE